MDPRWRGAARAWCSAWGAAALLGLALPASGQTLRWSSQGDALTMDPHSQNEGLTNALTGQVYDKLVRREAVLIGAAKKKGFSFAKLAKAIADADEIH